MDHSDLINVESPLLQTVHVEANGNNIIFLQPLNDSAAFNVQTMQHQEDILEYERQENVQHQSLYILPRNIQFVRDTPIQGQVSSTASVSTYGLQSTCGVVKNAPRFIDDSLVGPKDSMKKVQAKTCILKVNSEAKTVEEFSVEIVKLEAPESSNLNENQLQTEIVKKAEPTQQEKLIPKQLRALQNFVSIPDSLAPSRAVASLPGALVRRRDVVYNCRPLPPRVRFGPVQGVCKPVSAGAAAALAARASLRREPVFLLRRPDGGVTHVDTSDPDKSNWISLLPLGEQSANVWLHQVDCQLYAVTVRVFDRRTPLVLGYSKKYAEDHGLKDQPVLDLEAELSQWPSQWWCFECSRATPSYRELERHYKMYHKEDTDKILKRRRYKCRHCTKRFVRLFSLKRHVSMFCPNRKPINPPETPALEQNFTDDPVQNGDDSYRTPSDESLQNFTNLLDLSTNLFDTDRMPNLDGGGWSKSDNEFNFYGLKDENRLEGFEFPDFPDADGEGVRNSKKRVHYLRSSSPISCPYCKQHMLRGKLKQHARVCKARKFTCVCGREFLHKETLQRHVRSAHRVTTPSGSKATQGEVVETTENQYQCDQCRFVFKRRGMLLNHLHKSHGGGTGGGAPLLVRRRAFPCPLCPKLYQSVAKRHKHVLAHHPGVTYDRRACVLGPLQPARAAACAHCPHQYATRAKMLQHARKMHPDAAPPPSYADVTDKNKSKSTRVSRGQPTASTSTRQELDFREATLPHTFLDS